MCILESKGEIQTIYPDKREILSNNLTESKSKGLQKVTINYFTHNGERKIIEMKK